MASQFEKIPDFNFREEYAGHKCSINFNSDFLHSRHLLTSCSSIKEFLSFYREYSNLDIPDPFPEESIDYSVSDACQALCMDCRHSSFHVLALSDHTYHLPDRTEGTTCPLENEFTRSVTIRLKTPYRKDLSCSDPFCKNYRQVTTITPDGYTTPEFHDILYKGSPTIVEITRWKYKCPHCNKRIPGQLIAGIEIAPRYQLTSRLLQEIYKDCISSRSGGITLNAEKAIAEGYGINRKKLSAYLKTERKELVETYFSNLAAQISRQHKMQIGFDTDSAYCCKMVTTQNYSLSLFFRAPVEEDSAEPSTSAITLQMAFDDETIRAARAWMSGNFSAFLNLDYDHLIVFSHYFSATEYPHLDHSYAYHLVMLVFTYGLMLQDTQVFQQELQKFLLTRELKNSLSSGDFFKLSCTKKMAEDILAFGQFTGQTALTEAGQIFLEYVASFGRHASDKTFYRTRYYIGNLPAITNLQTQLEREFSQLPEISDAENWSESCSDEFYQTNPSLAIQRLLFFNEVAVAAALKNDSIDSLFNEDGSIRKDIDFGNGIPVELLESLLHEKGLFFD